MRYKAGDKVVIVKEAVSGMNQRGFMNKWFGTTMTIEIAYKNTRFPYKMIEDKREWEWNDFMIDHEATAKLTLPQPSKDMLKSGMKVVNRLNSIRYALVETKRFYGERGEQQGEFDFFDDDLKRNTNGYKEYDIMQLWEGDTLIAQRTEKSEAELKKESLEKQIDELSASINVSVKQMNKLKEEIKSL